MKGLTPSPEQQQILDLGLTSVRVRAGAGTGKTTTVAMVIANLIEAHHVDPEQILGITFTNKAAAELADKVRSVVGEVADPGRQVEVHTYHGFAAQILSEFGALAGADPNARVITPTFSRQLLSETFNHRSYDLLDITNRRTLDKIRALGDRMGDHLVTPEVVIAAADTMPQDEIWRARREMAQTIGEYIADKRRLNVVDYSDLVTLSTRVMIDNPGLAAAVRNRYQVVVLDEYQDTNPGQRVLLSTIFGDGFPVIAVGDEDQTIYEWRGASAENFELFPTQFTTQSGAPAHQKGLTLNRRSSSEILEVANRVRHVANPEADPLEVVDGTPPGEVTTYWAGDALQEADWIASRFEELHEHGEPWSSMAVLLRKNKDFAVVLDAMTRHDIPVEVANVGGLLSVPEVSELRAWLAILEQPENSAALTDVLMGSGFRLGMADIAPLSRRAQEERVFDDDEEEPTPITLLEALEDLATIPGIRPLAFDALRRFRGIYREVLGESQGMSLVGVVRMILDRTRAWQNIEALPPNPRLTARLNIYRFLDLAEDWSPLQGRPSLAAFLDYLSAMEEEPAEELDSAHLSGEEAVTLITVHRAKGLEWENVAIPAVAKGNFPSASQQYPDPIRFPESLPSELRIDGVMDHMPTDPKERLEFLRARHEMQEWRVAYVAVTRAKRRLFVSGAYWYGLPEPTKNPKGPSPLFEIVAESATSGSDGFAELGPRPQLLRPDPATAAPDPLFDEGWAGAMRRAAGSTYIPDLAAARELADEYERVLEDTNQRLFTLAEPLSITDVDVSAASSVTGLVTYAQCPKRFYWSEIDPLPRRRNPAAARGTEIHRRIELHQRGQVPFEEVSEALYDLVGGGEPGEPGGFDAYLESRFAEKDAALVEAAFTIDLSDDFQVRGRIDAVYADGTAWEVVDFKSGKPSDDPARMVQLQAYAVAATDADFGLPKPDSLYVTFAYLGGGVTEERYHADDGWIRSARARLGDIADAITSTEFAESPGEWCRSCDFLQFCAPGQAWLS